MSLNAQSLSVSVHRDLWPSLLLTTCKQEDLWTAYEDERLMNKLQNVRLRIKDRELQKKDQELEALRVAMLALTREVECQRESLVSRGLFFCGGRCCYARAVEGAAVLARRDYS